jgi:hypothetical protein
MDVPVPNSEVAAYIGAAGPRFQAVIYALRQVLFEMEPRLQEAVRAHRIVYTLRDEWRDWIFAISRTRQHVALTFQDGARLDDPAGLLQGHGPRLRQLTFTALFEVFPDQLAGLVHQAIAFHATAHSFFWRAYSDV